MVDIKVNLALILGLVKKTHSAEYVYINKNTMMTMNEFESVLSKIDYKETISEVSLFFKMSDMNLLLEAYKDALKENDSVMVDINSFPRPSMELYKRMIYKYDKLINEYRYHDTINDLHLHPTILDLMSSKSNSGRFNLIVEDRTTNRYLMIIYKGLLPLVKADTMNLTIFKPAVSNRVFYNEYKNDYDLEEDHFMAKFDIYKKKEKLIVQQYMLFKIPKNYVRISNT